MINVEKVARLQDAINITGGEMLSICAGKQVKPVVWQDTSSQEEKTMETKEQFN